MKLVSFSPLPVFTTRRLLLRQLTVDDALVLSVLRSNDSVNQYIERPKQCSVADALAFIKRIEDGLAQNVLLYWAISLKDNAGLIGTVCVWNFSDDDKTAELGYELSPDYQRQGMMNEALTAIIQYAFKDLGLTTLVAYVHHHNLASRKLLERLHFLPDAVRKDTENDNFIVYSVHSNTLT